MKTKFTLIVKQNGDWWLGWVEEVSGANAQEKTKKNYLLALEKPQWIFWKYSVSKISERAENNIGTHEINGG